MISIIIPVYNVEKYLPDCLDSVLSQSYDDLEIICVNDGSTDGSNEILGHYAERNLRIRVINQQNEGLSSARNTGIRNANGDYVFFLDSDDMIAPDAMQKIASLLDGCDLDILLFDGSLLFDDENAREEYGNDIQSYNRKNTYAGIMDGKKLFSQMYVTGDYRPNACLQLFSVSFLKENNLWFYPGIYHEDELFTFKALLLAEKVMYEPAPFYVRRVRSGSIMTAPKSYAHFKGYYVCYIEMLRFVLNKKYDFTTSETIKQCIARVRTSAYEIYTDLPAMEKCGVTWTEDAFALSLFDIDEYTRAKSLDSESESLRNSESYKLGLALSYPARKMNGWLHTYKRLAPISRADSSIYKKIINAKCSSKRKVFLLGSPVHGNLGDHLIAMAENDFFKKYFPDHLYFDFIMPFAANYQDILKRCMREQDLICLSGGGWLGTKWIHNEEFVRRIIQDFPKNPIVILPQTCFYEDAEAYVRKGAEIYRSHRNLLACARDRNSFNYMLEHGFLAREKLLLMPDFGLLYRGYKSRQEKRQDKISVCFRKDIEKVTSDNLKDDVMRYSGTLSSVTEVETNIYPIEISMMQREKAVKNKLREISESRLLITDRLHAMIFAVLTNTPCLAFDNATHKVSGVYEWLKDLDYIRMVDNHRPIKEQIEELYFFSSKSKFNDIDFSRYEIILRDQILTMMRQVGE